MKIVTDYWLKPIPTRAFDWQAYDAATYDGEGGPIGHGATEQEAIADLLEQIEDRAQLADWLNVLGVKA